MTQPGPRRLLGLFGAAVLCWLVALLLARHVAPAAGAAHAARQPSALPPVLINELLPHTDPPQVDAIEFYNSTGSDVDVSRWCLTDNHDDPCRHRIADGTIAPANGYLVLTQSDFGFGLSEMGEEVVLSQTDADGDLTGAQHRLEFGAAANGVAFGRVITSDGEEHLPALVAVTLGAANAAPLVGPLVIAEIMYHPPPGQDEYVELVNIGDKPIALYDGAQPKNTWRLTGVGEYVFPQGIELASHASLFITPLTPDEFRALHPLPAGALVVGPYSGSLSDSGEEINLLRPDTPNVDGSVPYLVVDRLVYADREAWPSAPDGSGPALQRRNISAFAAEPLNWQASVEDDGSRAALVELAEFTVGPSFDGAHRRVTWSTQRERNVLGFRLWRSDSGERGDAVEISGGLVVALGGRHWGASYAVEDQSDDGSQPTTYWLSATAANQDQTDITVAQATPIRRSYLPLVIGD
jgi:hypothetical protein